MYIGLSLSACTRDLYTKVVPIDQVLVIIAGTYIDPTEDDDWVQLWIEYADSPSSVWGSIPDINEIKIRDLVCQLYNSGRIHQPRKFGKRTPRYSYHWLRTVPAEIDKYPALQEAYDQLMLVAGLSNIKL